MCVVSMIGDHYGQTIPHQWPQVFPAPNVITITGVSREEFDALKREVEQMRALLIRAKRYDAEHGEPDCEVDEKVDLLRRIAEAVGVDLAEVFGVP